MSTIEQVQLSKLIFTHNWEDPATDEQALRIKPGDTLFAITSGGCNALGFLRFDPEAVFCVDINPAQTWLMELKKAALGTFTHDELLEFTGIRPCGDRLYLFNHLREHLSPQAEHFWRQNQNIIRRGIVMNGRYERFSKLAGRVLRLLQGGSKTRRFFRLTSLSEQENFYNRDWNNRRWQLIFSLMFNKKRLAKRGLNADYFHFDDGSSSFSESFHARAGHAMKNIPVASNYFLCLYLLGHYYDEDHVPEWLRKENHAVLQKNIQRINPITADGKYWLQQRPAGFFDGMSLSNICELMDDNDTAKLFTEVARTAKDGARIVFRNLMVPREVPESLRDRIVKDEAESRRLQLSDRSFVYGKIAAYAVKK
ncbi:MAG TPA: DUF3419 family protein [Puia sp.]|jgi:S-adenosylmethionine-diacylglycerol 3-amino-3-carboxypropyl transferase|nr:DUF3419 family protein [Puia sp.]